jgi:hypothetical protein
VGWSNSLEKATRTKEGKWLARAFRFLFRTLDKVSLRSFAQVVVHVCIAVALAALLYFGQFVGEAINDNDLVTILAVFAAASGALLAVSLALGIFSSQYYTDWTHSSRERLRNQLEKLEDRMQKSARKYPGISRRLVELYMLMVMYIPGQPVDFDKVLESDKVFHNWVKEQLKKSGKEIDFGNIDDYETFEKYAFDAGLVANESKDVLIELGLAEVYGRSLNTLRPVIATWGLVLVFSLVFAIIGSLDIICDNMNLSILIVPIYLCFFAGSAVVIDCWGLIEHMRAREKGYEMGVSAFIQQHGLEKYK